ncbi:unnamed protein product [Pylaiella littoralis]
MGTRDGDDGMLNGHLFIFHDRDDKYRQEWFRVFACVLELLFLP